MESSSSCNWVPVKDSLGISCHAALVGGDFCGAPRTVASGYSSRRRSKSAEGMRANAATTSGSNWAPEQRTISATAAVALTALRYGRSVSRASSVSATLEGLF